MKKNKLTAWKTIAWSIFILALPMICSFLSVGVCAADLENSDRIIVSLGDSYSSGEGNEPFFDQELPMEERVKSQDWLCHRSQKAWSGMLTLRDKDGKTILMNENRGTADKQGNWYFAAMSGAVTDNILDTDPVPKKVVTKEIELPIGETKITVNFDYDTDEECMYRYKDYSKFLESRNFDDIKNWDEYSKGANMFLGINMLLEGRVEIEPQLNIFDQLGEGRKADYVTLTIGGNDMNFTKILTKAAYEFKYINFNKGKSFSESISETLSQKNLNRVAKKLKDTYIAVSKAAGPQAKIIVADYPAPVTDGNNGIFFNDNEMKKIFAGTVIFNQTIRNIVEECKKEGYPIYFVDVMDKFNEEDCFQYINSISLYKEQDINVNERVSAYSMHPNILGILIYAKCVQAKIDELEQDTVFWGIVNNEDGKLLSGVKVTVTDQYGRACGETVAQNGQYELKTGRDSECIYTVTFEKDGYQPLRVSDQESSSKILVNATLDKSEDYVEGQDDREMYRAYKSVIKQQLIQYGKGSIQDDFFSGGTYCLNGLGVVRLIDLDKDGQDELVTIGYEENKDSGQHYRVTIFRFDGEKAVQVYVDRLCSDIAPVNFTGKGSCEGFNYYDHGDTFRVLTRNEYGVFYNLTWSELKDNEMVAAETISYEYNSSTKATDYYIDGKSVSEAEYNKRVDEMHNSTSDIQCSGSTVETMQSVLDETDRVLQKLGYSITASEQRYSAYRNKVEELIGIYGKPSVRNEYYGGVAFVRLIDFDDDGNEELYCAYAEKSGRIDQQEIFGFENNKIVSLFKGDINNFGTYAEPFVKFTTDDCMVYILSGNHKTEGGDPGIYIGIENGKLITNSDLDNSFEFTCNVMAFGSSDHLRNTITVMHELGCKEYNIINKAEYDSQLKIYKLYVESDEWKNSKTTDDKFSGIRSGPVLENLKTPDELFFDYDGDGTLEMWLNASSDRSGWPETLSVFCTIKNGKVVELLKTGECGGELGGGYVTLSYCEPDDKLYIGIFDHARGFGGVAGSLTAYTMSNGILEEAVEYTAISYSQGMGESVFTVNGKNVTPEEERDFSANYINLNQDTAKQILFNTSYAVSIKEKLKE